MNIRSDRRQLSLVKSVSYTNVHVHLYMWLCNKQFPPPPTRHWHNSLEKKEEESKKRIKRKLICDIHAVQAVVFDSAFYKGQSSGSTLCNQPTTQLLLEFSFKAPVFIIYYTQCNFTYPNVSSEKKPHLFEMRSCPLTHIKWHEEPPLIHVNTTWRKEVSLYAMFLSLLFFLSKPQS